MHRDAIFRFFFSSFFFFSLPRALCSFSTSTCIIILFTLHLLNRIRKHTTHRSHLHNMFKCFAFCFLSAALEHFFGWACPSLSLSRCLLHFSVAFNSISVRHTYNRWIHYVLFFFFSFNFVRYLLNRLILKVRRRKNEKQNAQFARLKYFCVFRRR